MPVYSSEFNSYDLRSEEKTEIELPEKIDNISFSYDGGRVEVVINGITVVSSYSGGNDCGVSINRKK